LRLPPKEICSLSKKENQGTTCKTCPGSALCIHSNIKTYPIAAAIQATSAEVIIISLPIVAVLMTTTPWRMVSQDQHAGISIILGLTHCSCSCHHDCQNEYGFLQAVCKVYRTTIRIRRNERLCHVNFDVERAGLFVTE
jgi:hypothetical protein